MVLVLVPVPLIVMHCLSESMAGPIDADSYEAPLPMT